MSTDVNSPGKAASLPDDPARLRQLLEQTQATLVESTTTIATQQRRIAQLEQQLRELLRARFGPRSERIDPNQGELFDVDKSETTGAQPAAVACEPAVEVRGYRRGGGRRELPEALPRERVEHDLAEDQKRCPSCGERRVRIGADSSEQLEYVPATLKIIEHVRHKYACKRCGEHVAIAPKPAKPIDKGVPGPGLLAALVVGKYSEHLTLYRFEDILARHGVEIPRGVLCRWVRETAVLVRPLYDVLVARVLRSRVIHTDDTPVPVLDASLPKTRTSRLWVYCGDWDNPYTAYDYTTSRRRDGPERFLKTWSGFLQADAFAGYDGIYAARTAEPVYCWAHARRKFFESRTAQPEPAHRALGFIQRLYAVEREAAERFPGEEWKHDAAVRSEFFALRQELRQEKAHPLLEEFRAQLVALESEVLPKSPMGQAIGYVLPRWAGLVRYCQHGMLSIDNNLSERMVRPCAIGRKNWLFFGADSGGQTAAILYSLLASAKINQVEPFAYLRDVIDQLSQHDFIASAAESLLPDRWLTSHSSCRAVGPTDPARTSSPARRAPCASRNGYKSPTHASPYMERSAFQNPSIRCLAPCRVRGESPRLFTPGTNG